MARKTGFRATGQMLMGLMLLFALFDSTSAYGAEAKDPTEADQAPHEPVYRQVRVVTVDPMTERAVVKIDSTPYVMRIGDEHKQVTLLAVAEAAVLEVRMLDGTAVGLRLNAGQERALRLDREPEPPTPIAVPISSSDPKSDGQDNTN